MIFIKSNRRTHFNGCACIYLIVRYELPEVETF